MFLTDDQRRHLARLRVEAHRELTEGILPFYGRYALDDEHGGFHGRVDLTGRPVPGADKSAVLVTRIAWTFSRAHRRLGDPEWAASATRAQRYLLDHVWDRRHGGLVVRVDHRGRPVQPAKNAYVQSYGVFALAEHHLATGAAESLEGAVELHRLIERHLWDPRIGGYHDGRRPDWSRGRRERLGGRRFARLSMNVHLHLLEAYTVLAAAWDDPDVRRRQAHLIEVILHRFLDPAARHFRQDHDGRWRPLDAERSYGHDLETCWLLNEALDALGDHPLTDTARAVVLEVAAACVEEGLDDSGAVTMGLTRAGVPDHRTVWWTQAEGLVGCLDAFERSGEDRFLRTAVGLWDFIQRHLVNRPAGEWRLSPQPDPAYVESELAIGPMKGPYHAGRACLEAMERAARMLGDGAVGTT